MKELDIFDTFCLNQECLSSISDAFFLWSDTNQHVINSHDSQTIHPKTYSKIFSRPQDLTFSLKDRIANELEIKVQKILDKISNFIKERYYRKKISALLEQIDSLSSNNVTDLTQKMKKGNRFLLQQMVNYKLLSQKMTIKRYLSTKIQERYNEFNSQIEKDSEQIPLLIGIFVSDKKQFSQVIQIAKQRKNLQELLNLNIVKKEEEWFSQQQQIAQLSNKKVQKMKRIKKMNKENKNVSLNICSSSVNVERNQKINRVADQQLQIQQEKVWIVVQSLKEQQARSYLNQNHNKIEAIHIFNHEFAIKQNIREVIKRCENIKILTFNCAHQFDESLIYELSNQQRKNIRTLNLNWQFNCFFNEYYIYRYFQYKSWDYFQNIYKIIYSIQTLRKLPNNNSLCINNGSSVKKIQIFFNSLDKIQTLHLHFDLQMKQNSPLYEICNFKNLNNLKTLDLKCISFKKSHKYFPLIIQNNKSIQRLLIRQCTGLKNLDKLLSCLQNLSELTHLSLQSKENQHKDQQYMTISPNTIFSLVKLTSLHLYKVTFENIQTYYSSCQLRQIYRLRKLTHLSVYACIPIFSDLLTYLHHECIHNLVLLNIGYTSIDNQISKSLVKMKSLQYLNIQNNDIQGEDLVKAFKTYFQIHKSKSALKYLQFDETRYMKSKNVHQHKWRFTLESVKQIGEYLPYIQYLSVYKYSNLNSYDFAQYKNLKILAIEAQQQVSLQANISPTIRIFIKPSIKIHND